MKLIDWLVVGCAGVTAGVTITTWETHPIILLIWLVAVILLEVRQSMKKVAKKMNIEELKNFRGVVKMTKQEERCPYYRPPRMLVDPKTDKVYEGSAMCDLVDKFCLREYGGECEVYDEFLKEIKEV